MADSSFYGDTPNYATDFPTQNDSNTNPVTGNSAAPSAFYPNGGQYAALADSDVVVAEMTALAAQTSADAASASASATAAAASAAAAADAGSSATATPLMDSGAGAVGVSLKHAREDHVHPTDTSRAPLASPALTGTPTAPTAAVNTNTTQLATTAFVLGQAGSATPLINGTAAVGTATKFAREDHVHPTDSTRAPLASPALTGTPTAPTASVGTSSTQVATTAFVLANSRVPNTTFSANKNGTDQASIASATWTKITYGTTVWNDSGLYDTTNSKWVPPSGKVKLTAAVYVSVGVVDQAQSLLAIYKNGVVYKNVAIVNSSGTSGFVMNGSCIDVANGTDYYEVYVNIAGAGTKTVSGAAQYTWFVGEML